MLSNLSNDTEIPRPITLFRRMGDEYRDIVVRDVLNRRSETSRTTRNAFDSAVNETLTAQDIPQFPRQPARAAPGMLLAPVLRAVRCSNALACATLRVWAESHKSLEDVVSERLGEIGVEAEYPDFLNNRFRGHLPSDEWERETDTLVELHGDLDRDDVALMLCYVSGKMPYTGESERVGDDENVDSRILNGTIEYLESLSPTSPEWDRTIPAFAKKVEEIVGAKEEERNRAVALDSSIAEIGNEFSGELAYLELGIGAWSATSLSSGEDMAEALGVSEELRSALSEYRALRGSPRPVNRIQERERRGRNDALEDRIDSLSDRVNRLMFGEPMPEDDPSGKLVRSEKRSEAAGSATESSRALREGTAPVPRSPEAFSELENEQPYHENISAQLENEELERENESLRDEVQNLESENQSLRADVHRLESENQTLRLDKEDLKREMRAELNKSRDEVARLRFTYDEERNIPRPALEDVPAHIESVDDAVRYAREMFSDRLLLKTNSKSVVKDNPFEKPEDVWRALQWLATIYHSAKMGELSVPDFDHSLREMCGWWYKSDQHETTRNKYRDWYTTRVNGDRRWLLEHIGTGSSKDARHTIRIAFDWEKDEKMVVVGFIGQHQRTDAT